MGPLDLDMDERRLVTRILLRAYEDQKVEIHRTETASMKDELRRELSMLVSVLGKLGVSRELAA